MKATTGYRVHAHQPIIILLTQIRADIDHPSTHALTVNSAVINPQARLATLRKRILQCGKVESYAFDTAASTPSEVIVRAAMLTRR